MSGWLGFLILAIACLPFVGIGSWGLLRISRDFHYLAQCESWNHVTGRVTSSEISTSSDNYGTELDVADIWYEYEVDGIVYKSKKIQFGDITANTKKLQALAEEFAVGREVDVYYQPDNPYHAVLIKDMDYGRTLYVFFMMMVFFLLPLFMFFLIVAW